MWKRLRYSVPFLRNFFLARLVFRNPRTLRSLGKSSARKTCWKRTNKWGNFKIHWTDTVSWELRRCIWQVLWQLAGSIAGTFSISF